MAVHGVGARLNAGVIAIALAAGLAPAAGLRDGPPLNAARAAHTMTRLPDGRVLVVGGFGADERQLAPTELFDPGTGRFTLGPTPRVARQSHTATALPDGRVAIIGGFDAAGEPTGSIEIYDPESETFAAGGTLATPRAGHTATLLANGQILIVGGVGRVWQFLASTELFDVAGRGTSSGADMAEPRESHTATQLRDGRVLIIGGHAGRHDAIRIYEDAEVYDPVADAFAPAGRMATRRHKHDAVLLSGGDVLVTGGSDERDDRGAYRSAELYRPGVSRFEPLPAMALTRYKHAGTSIRMPDGRVLVAGGGGDPEVFDPVSRRFSLVPGEARPIGQFVAAVELDDGQVLITGGYGGGHGPGRDTWLYGP